MGVEWLVTGRREMRPLLVKVGVAVSLSVAGYLCSHLVISRPDRRRLRDQHPHAAPGICTGVEGGREPCAGLKDEILLLQREEARSNVVVNGAAGIKAAAAMADAHRCSQSKISRDEEEERVVSEFNALVLQEFEQAGVDMAALEPPPLKSDYKNGPDVHVAEPVVVLLKSLLRSLHEQERSPVIPLLEYYYGLGEQEYSAAMELESRLKVSAVEEAGFVNSLKIETLQAESRRQAADHRETKAELESARAKVRRLGRKLKSESLRAKQRVAVLQRRVVALQDMVRRRAEEAERRLTKVKDLEGEVAELRRANSNLAVENSDMAKKLESMESLASSGLPSSETATEESNSLRQKNEELTEQLEQLQTDHCTDVEKLVYLRWVNACMRYKLQNYQSPPEKTVAMDLSRTLIPESEHRVKQLILEYANSGVIAEKGINMADFDSDTYSFSHASSEEPDRDITVEVSGVYPMKRGGASSGKKKFFTKLKRFVLSMENKGHNNKFNAPVRWVVTPP